MSGFIYVLRSVHLPTASKAICDAYTSTGFVASTPDSVIVSISGTNISSPDSIAIDLDFPLVDIDQTMFPGSDGVKVHKGFYGAFGRMQVDILAAVQGQANQGQILVVGHSLGEPMFSMSPRIGYRNVRFCVKRFACLLRISGAALTQIMATYLQKQLSDSTVTAKGFAPPRSGNDAWADYIDATVSRFLLTSVTLFCRHAKADDDTARQQHRTHDQLCRYRPPPSPSTLGVRACEWRSVDFKRWAGVRGLRRAGEWGESAAPD